MAVHQVEKRGKFSYLGEILLMTISEHNEPDTNLDSADKMHTALYDAHQCNELMKDGDAIETEHGFFHVHGIHVIAAHEAAPYAENHLYVE